MHFLGLGLCLIRAFRRLCHELCQCHHGCGFVADGAPYALSRFSRVVGKGGFSNAQIGEGVSRICCRLLSRCLLGPSCSGYPLLIGLLPPLIDGTVPSSRAEVVDREDTVEDRP